MPKEHKPKQAAENKPTNAAARHNARQYALQALYQWQLSHNPIQDIEAEFLKYHIDERLDLAYFKELIQGVAASNEVDPAIKEFIARSLTEIDPVELAVLRLAVYELLHRPDVPYRVIINEALELTKQFGSVEGYKFVNGVLDRIARKCRTHE